MKKGPSIFYYAVGQHSKKRPGWGLNPGLSG